MNDENLYGKNVVIIGAGCHVKDLITEVHAQSDKVILIAGHELEKEKIDNLKDYIETDYHPKTTFIFKNHRLDDYISSVNSGGQSNRRARRNAERRKGK